MTTQAATPPLQDTKRNQGLDFLRGLAILLVMVGHFLPEALPGFYAGQFSSLGGAGVLLFFYLSGFLIFRNLQTQSAPIFLTRRFFKLFPAYWLDVIAILALSFFLGIGNIPTLKIFISNVLMIQEWTHSPLMNNAFWTLQIEVKFYFLMVLFFISFNKERIYWLLALLFLINLLAWPALHRGSTLVTYLIAFFPGIAAARAEAAGWIKNRLLEFAGVTLLASVNFYVFLTGEMAAYQAFYAMFFSCLMAFAMTGNWHSRILGFLATISYSLYLYHTVIGYPLIDRFHFLFPGWAGIALGLGAASALSLLIATLSFYSVERPGIKFGRSLELRAIPALMSSLRVGVH